MDIASGYGLWIFLGRIFLSALLGALLGFERDKHGRGAGLRTHLLVSMGGCVFMILSTQVESFGTLNLPDFVRVTDPGRIAAQVVSGIGFLGAGVILKEGLSIRGLTTAACLWVSAAIGMASGAGFYTIAVFTTILALFALVVLRYYENFYRKDVYRTLTVSVSNDVNIEKIISMVQIENVKVNSYSIKRNYEDGITILEMSLCLFSKGESEYLSYIIMSILEAAIKMKSVYWLKP